MKEQMTVTVEQLTTCLATSQMLYADTPAAVEAIDYLAALVAYTLERGTPVGAPRIPAPADAMQSDEDAEFEALEACSHCGITWGERRALKAIRAPAADAGGLMGAAAELDRIKRLASCGTAYSFLALPDADKRYWFAQCMDESERRKLAEARLHFLHINNQDAEGWEWGVVRLRNFKGRVEYLWGLSDHSDIDAAMAEHDRATAKGTGDLKGGA